jgi:hypothetical protein
LAATDILDLKRGDRVVIHELDGGEELELLVPGTSTSRSGCLIMGQSRTIQGSDGHPSLFCNVPKIFNFEAGDDVDVVVYPDRIRIQPAEHS